MALGDQSGEIAVACAVFYQADRPVGGVGVCHFGPDHRGQALATAGPEKWPEPAQIVRVGEGQFLIAQGLCLFAEGLYRGCSPHKGIMGPGV